MDVVIGSFIFGIIGLITTAIWDIDLPKLYADLSLFVVICIIVFFNINDTTSMSEKIIKAIFDTFPALIIGDFIGSILLKSKNLFGF
jgi:hypothetical protein